MTVSVVAATGSVLEIQYFHPQTGVKFPCGSVCYMDLKGWMDKALMIRCTLLQSVWLKIVDPCIMHTPGYFTLM